MTIGALTCNYLTNPLGVDDAHPRLSWRHDSDRPGWKQSAYRILAATTKEQLTHEKGYLWDSGKVQSDASLLIAYDGTELTSRQRVWWAVHAWDEMGAPCGWSEPAFWEMGLLRQDDWKARWIGRVAYKMPRAWEPAPAAFLRKEFMLPKPIKSARAYVTGVGYYELHLNGEKIGDELLTPAVTHYERRVCYQVFDITGQLCTGKNAVGMILGDGWYCHLPTDSWGFSSAPWRGYPRCLVQLAVTYEDGSEELVLSDHSWSVTGDGPIIANGIRTGERYDARKELPGWDTPDYDESAWQTAPLVPGPGGLLSAQQTTPIRIVRTRAPKSIREVRPGVHVVDFGENISGVCRITLCADAGTEVTLRYGEKVLDDGDLDQSNIATLMRDCEIQTDKYICSGNGRETWAARFTYHGFQYVQVTGWPGAMRESDIEACVLHTAFAGRGGFRCSNELLNSIQDCTRRATLGNFHGFPTDCPHREKNGWTGDAHLSAEACILNFDPMSAYTEWMHDFRDLQRANGALPAIVPSGGWGFTWGNGPAWDSAAFLIPWYMYQYCGDVRILLDQYDLMKKYVTHLESLAINGIVSYGLGDWCPPHRGAGDPKCKPPVTSTAYFFVDVRILAATARLAGDDTLAAEYDRKAEEIRVAFNRAFVAKDTCMMEGDTQTSYACALYQGLLDEADEGKVFAHLMREVEAQHFHFDTGILGTKYILYALSDAERADAAYALLTQTDFPGYGHWIARGATTLWENWEGDASASRNHHMFGDVSAWMVRVLAGLNPGEPGFKKILLRPHFVEGLDWVEAWHDSVYGRIACAWKLDAGEIALDVTIPANTTARVSLPCAESATVRANGLPPRDATRSGNGKRLEWDLSAGRHAIVIA